MLKEPKTQMLKELIQCAKGLIVYIHTFVYTYMYTCTHVQQYMCTCVCTRSIFEI